MWLTIISSVIFFALAVIMFTPQMRFFFLYRSFSFYFLFEGIFSIINFAVSEIWPESNFMHTVYLIGCIILGSYILICCYKHLGKKGTDNI